jgi:hypothetical protein
MEFVSERDPAGRAEPVTLVTEGDGGNGGPAAGREPGWSEWFAVENFSVGRGLGAVLAIIDRTEEFHAFVARLPGLVERAVICVPSGPSGIAQSGHDDARAVVEHAAEDPGLAGVGGAATGFGQGGVSEAEGEKQGAGAEVHDGVE